MLQIDCMLKRKMNSFFTILREGGLPGLYRYSLRKMREQTGTMDGCTFGAKGIKVEVLRNDILNGVFEQFERSAVRQYLSPVLPVVELGGCMGVVSCITNRLLQDPAAHVVVEANPQVIPLLKANRRRNGCTFEILNRAVAYGSTTIEYAPSLNFAGNSLAEDRGNARVKVATTSLGDIVQQRRFDRYTLICDIEGHECELVEQESAILRRADTIILETHARMVGEEKNQAMLARLHEIGFTIIASDSYVVVLRNQAAVAAA